MIILNPDGTTGYSLGGILPAGCVEIGLDGCQVAQAAAAPTPPETYSLGTPPVPKQVIPAPKPITPASPKIDYDFQAALTRFYTRTGLPK